MKKFTNTMSYNVCWKGINVAPGQTVEAPKKQKSKSIKGDKK